jgi:hypothetical protein
MGQFDDFFFYQNQPGVGHIKVLTNQQLTRGVTILFKKPVYIFVGHIKVLTNQQLTRGVTILFKKPVYIFSLHVGPTWQWSVWI